MKLIKIIVVLTTFCFFALFSCETGKTGKAPILETIAKSEKQWTGVTVSKSGRIFVSYPRWFTAINYKVGEIVNGQLLPYPNAVRNEGDKGSHTDDRFVCVQSVYVDDKDFLWILDAANPYFAGVVPSGAKLHKVDLTQNKVIKTYGFDAKTVFSQSYLNDVRIDNKRGLAFITDSGKAGLVVLDLASGANRRVLDGHVSTLAEKSVLTLNGKVWEGGEIHTDGIALSPDGEWLYYRALMSDNLYRVPVAALADTAVSEPELSAKVNMAAKTGPVAGMLFGKNGDLYMGGLADNSIKVLRPSGELQTIIQNDGIIWADSFGMDGKGNLYFTVAKINIPMKERKNTTYALMRIKK